MKKIKLTREFFETLKKNVKSYNGFKNKGMFDIGRLYTTLEADLNAVKGGLKTVSIPNWLLSNVRQCLVDFHNRAAFAAFKDLYPDDMDYIVQVTHKLIEKVEKKLAKARLNG